MRTPSSLRSRPSALSFCSALLVLVLSAQANAGMAQASISCVSDSGKTKIESIFPGDSEEANLLFTIEDKVLAYENIEHKEGRDMNGNRWGQEFDGAAIVDIEAKDILPKMFSLKVLKAGAVVFQMKDIPNSLRSKKTPNGLVGKFSAKVQGVDPRHGGPSKVITVRCNYSYEI